MRGYFALGAILYPKLWVSPVALHFFNLLPGGHSSLEPRLPIPNRTVKRVCADDSVPFAHAKVGYRHAIFKTKPRARTSAGVFCLALQSGEEHIRAPDLTPVRRAPGGNSPSSAPRRPP